MKKITVIPAAIAGSISIMFSGFCPCTMTGMFSVAGIITIGAAFIAENKVYLFMGGIALIAIGLLSHSNKKHCGIHK